MKIKQRSQDKPAPFPARARFYRVCQSYGFYPWGRAPLIDTRGRTAREQGVVDYEQGAFIDPFYQAPIKTALPGYP